MSANNLILSMWQRLSPRPGGKWLFSRLVCWKAPYFASIAPRFETLRPGYCEVRFKKRRRVLNHIGTVHAIAMCNAAELVGGTLTDAIVPATHRWIPKGMAVEYVAKATTDLRAIAELTPPTTFGDSMELAVPVQVQDAKGKIVLRALITMWVTRKKNKR